MEQENYDDLDIETQEEETEEPNTSEESTEEEETESVDDLKEELAKAKEIAENQRIRAEKAEKKAKENNKDDLSQTDLLAIMTAKVNMEDLDYIKKFAKLEGVSISEVLKNEELKQILDVKEEKRRTALATNTGTSKRGQASQSSESILSEASKGRLPDDPSKLANARWDLKKK